MADVAQPDVGFLNAESRRSLEAASHSTSPTTVKIPRDTVIKRMYLELYATFDVTYAAGSPTFSELGVFERICSNIEININGNRIVKSVRPHLARMHDAMWSGSVPRRSYETSASAFTKTRAGREWFAGSMAYPATTQFVLVNEGFHLHFELPQAGENKYATELDVRDVSSADVRFNWVALTNIQKDGAGATVTYANNTVNVQPQIIENRARPRPAPNQLLFDYVETSVSRQYSGQANGQQIDLQTGNYLAGVGILCLNGGSDRLPADNLLKNCTLKINGSNSVQGPVDFKQLQDSSLGRAGAFSPLGGNGYHAAYAATAGAQVGQGFAYMNLIRNGDWSTAVNTSRASGVDSVKLEFDVPSSSGTDAATFTTNNLEVTAHTHEVRPFAYSR